MRLCRTKKKERQKKITDVHGVLKSFRINSFLFYTEFFFMVYKTLLEQDEEEGIL